MKNTISEETKNQAIKIAKATQKPGQTKDQTKLIVQGIEKGIAEYKKQQKAKARERDKTRKLKQKTQPSDQPSELNLLEVSEIKIVTSKYSAKLPWALLILSWLGFILVHFMSK